MENLEKYNRRNNLMTNGILAFFAESSATRTGETVRETTVKFIEFCGCKLGIVNDISAAHRFKTA